MKWWGGGYGHLELALNLQIGEFAISIGFSPLIFYLTPFDPFLLYQTATLSVAELIDAYSDLLIVEVQKEEEKSR